MLLLLYFLIPTFPSRISSASGLGWVVVWILQRGSLLQKQHQTACRGFVSILAAAV